MYFLKKQNEENLDSTEGNLIRTSNDLTDTANNYIAENAGLKSFDEGVIEDFDTEGGTKNLKSKTIPDRGGAEATQKDIIPQENLIPTLSSQSSVNDKNY